MHFTQQTWMATEIASSYKINSTKLFILHLIPLYMLNIVCTAQYMQKNCFSYSFYVSGNVSYLSDIDCLITCLRPWQYIFKCDNYYGHMWLITFETDIYHSSADPAYPSPCLPCILVPTSFSVLAGSCMCTVQALPLSLHFSADATHFTLTILPSHPPVTHRE